MEESLGLNHTEAGSLLFFRSSGGLVAYLFFGYLAAWLTYHRLIIISLLTQGAVLLGIGLSGSYLHLALAYFCLGLVVSLFTPAGLAVISDLAPKGHIGRAMAIYEISPNAGMIAAPLIAQGLLIWFDWQGVFYFAGGACLLAGLAYARWGSGGDYRSPPPSLASLKGVLGQRVLWVLCALLCLGLITEVGIYTLLPLYLVTQRNFELETANILVSLSRLPSLAVVLSAGFLCDLWGLGKTIFLSLVITGLALILLAYGPDSLAVAMVFVQSAAGAGLFPPTLARLARHGPPQTRALTISLTVAVAAFSGAGLIPVGIGYLADLGLFDLALAAGGGLTLLGIPLLAWLKPEE
jgi:NNP family nitrate/nitrite transporter-like MFS transporter